VAGSGPRAVVGPPAAFRFTPTYGSLTVVIIAIDLCPPPADTSNVRHIKVKAVGGGMLDGVRRSSWSCGAGAGSEIAELWSASCWAYDETKQDAVPRQSYLVSSHAQHYYLVLESELGRHGLRRHAGFSWVEAGQGPMAAGHALYFVEWHTRGGGARRIWAAQADRTFGDRPVG
jgi:hypothetical protein